jgi:hypothetical protein
MAERVIFDGATYRSQQFQEQINVHDHDWLVGDKPDADHEARWGVAEANPDVAEEAESWGLVAAGLLPQL